jgi:hypothetical protein
MLLVLTLALKLLNKLDKLFGIRFEGSLPADLYQGLSYYRIVSVAGHKVSDWQLTMAYITISWTHQSDR